MYKAQNRPFLGHSQYILWATDPDRGFCALLEEKKNKQKKPSGIFLVRDFSKSWLFWGKKNNDLEKNILSYQQFRGKNKIKLK